MEAKWSARNPLAFRGALLPALWAIGNICALSGCGTPPGATVDRNTLATQPAFAKCGLSASFSGNPRTKILTKKALEQPSYADLDTYEMLEYIDGYTYSEGAMCMCFRTLIPSNTTASQIRGNTSFVGALGDITVESSDVVENGPFGKTWNFEGTMPSPAGKITTEGSVVLQPHCMFVIEGSYTSAMKASQAKSFVASVRAITPASSANLPQSTDTADKLQKLKELFDQKLISQDEYDAKRKAILDGM